MKTLSIARRINGAYLVRCKYFAHCCHEDCLHHDPHRPSTNSCVMHSPVKYCRQARGFVHDVPASDIDSMYECDPNLAFKAKRKADQQVQESTSTHHNNWRESDGYSDEDDF